MILRRSPELRPFVDRLVDRVDALLLGAVDKGTGVDDEHVGELASGVIGMPAAWRWPIMISESIRFFAQPSEIRPTVVFPSTGMEKINPPP